MCNRCSCRLEQICHYQRAQCCLQPLLHSNPHRFTEENCRQIAVCRKWSVEHWACLIVVLGGDWKRLSNSSREQSQHCYRQHPDLPANIPAFSQFQGGRGERLGWQWQIKPVTFSLPSLSLFCCKAAPSSGQGSSIRLILLFVIGNLFSIIQERIAGWKFTSISYSSSLYYLFLLIFPLSPLRPFLSLRSLIYVAMWPHSIDSSCFLIRQKALSLCRLVHTD